MCNISLPADECLICGKAIEDAGGMRLVGQSLRGVGFINIPHIDFIKNGVVQILWEDIGKRTGEIEIVRLTKKVLKGIPDGIEKDKLIPLLYKIWEKKYLLHELKKLSFPDDHIEIVLYHGKLDINKLKELEGKFFIRMDDEKDDYLLIRGFKLDYSFIKRGRTAYHNGLHPWFCQVCGYRICHTCKFPINFPMGATILTNDGQCLHCAIFPFEPGCCNSLCEKHRDFKRGDFFYPEPKKI